jgi:hypothetical protein
MTEARAHVLLITAGVLLTSAVMLGLNGLGANGRVLLLGFMVPATLVGLGVGWVVVRFEDPEHEGSRRPDR